MVTEDNWRWLMVTYVFWWWLTVTDGDLRSLRVTDGDLLWLIVTDIWWRWLTWLAVTDGDPVLKIKDRGDHGRRTKDILGGPKSLETKKLGSSKGWEDQSAEKTNNWKDKKYITNRWDAKKLNILLKTETTVHCEIIHLWRGNLVCMCSYPC